MMKWIANYVGGLGEKYKGDALNWDKALFEVLIGRMALLQVLTPVMTRSNIVTSNYDTCINFCVLGPGTATKYMGMLCDIAISVRFGSGLVLKNAGGLTRENSKNP